MKTASPTILLTFFIGTLAGVVLENRFLSENGRTGADRATRPDAMAANWQPAQLVDNSPRPANQNETSATAAVETGSPRLVVENAIYNFGERESGEIVEHVFTVKNAGTAALKIERVETACGCTAAKLSSNEIAPGKEVQLAVKLSLAVQKGPQDRDITLHTNDSDNRQVRLSLVGTAVPRVTLIPERAEMMATAEAAPEPFVLKVVAERGLKFNVKGIRTSGEQVAAEVKAVKPNEEFNVIISLKPPLPIGQFRGWVHLLTDNKGEYAVVGIPVAATVVAAQALEDRTKKPVDISDLQSPEYTIKPTRQLTASSPR